MGVCRTLKIRFNFLNGLIRVGEEKIKAGRIGDFASNRLAKKIREIGLNTGSLKTGTHLAQARHLLKFGLPKFAKSPLAQITLLNLGCNYGQWIIQFREHGGIGRRSGLKIRRS